MKKVLILTSAILLLAAACNKQVATLNNNSSNQNVFNPVTVKVGDKVGGMKLVSIESEEGKTAIDPDRFSAQFKGPITISAHFYAGFPPYDILEGPTCDLLFFDLSSDSELLVPKLANSETSICIDDSTKIAKDLFHNSQGTAIVTIDDLSVSRGFIDSVEDGAKFVSLVSINDQFANLKTYTNAKYGFEFKYPATWLNFEDDTKIGIADSSVSQGDRTCKTKQEVQTNYQLCPVLYFNFGKINSATSFDNLLTKPEYKNIQKLKKVANLDIAELPDGYLVYDSSAHKSIEIMSDFYRPGTTVLEQILSTFKFTK